MLRFTIATALLMSAFTLPAYAANTMMMKCDDASMMKAQSDVDAMTGPMMKEKKAMASKEMMMAKESMKAKKMDDCKMHMEKAMKSIGKM
ncbi:hypothetical protein RHSP_31242 [Rhizobium freirei PRF 81]|uniref:Pentapeptide MXKDX repeat protein n=1 Tax=Rhizobium freirei PRF 81 TaxID=363754 RepID=N6V1B2_9HYPH|nr:hypothetical protein [Rhizobium freirei]ENN86811.1 hypothetical protein RHSP_31242 [Rhizobium freirei PRF 81]